MARRLVGELNHALARSAEGDSDREDRDAISVVCHDLKDPLASIVMGVGFLRKTGCASDPAVRRVVDAIGRSAERMGQVVSDLHDWTKLQAGLLALKIRAYDVDAALVGALDPMSAQAREKGVDSLVERAGSPVVALCDAARTVQIVSKLVGNAIRFTPAGGRVTVAYGCDDAEAVARLSVSDTGRGIAPERLEVGVRPRRERATHAARRARLRAATPSRAGSRSSTAGRVQVDSRVGEGTTFTVTLPLAAPAPGSSGAMAGGSGVIG